MTIASSSASSSARWLSLTPRYLVRASSTMRSRVATARRCGDARPRLPWAIPSTPIVTNRWRSRQAVRSLIPSKALTSATVRPPSRQRPRTSIRCWSRVFNVSLSLIVGD